VSPEVSDLDFSSAVSVAGTSVPGFTVRRLNTEVELADGQSFALAGLLQNKVTASKSQVPFLGDIPVLGLLFRSVNYQRAETELVVLVTPRLVEPMNPDQVTALPGEHWRYPNGLQYYGLADLGGPVVEGGKSDADKSKGKTAAASAATTSAPPPQFHGTYGYSPVGAGSTTGPAVH
jgi:pilus assembly protein CpaC